MTQKTIDKRFTSVADARERVDAIQDLSDNQVRTFVRVFNMLEAEGTREPIAIAMAISAANDVEKNLDKNTLSDKYSRMQLAVTEALGYDYYIKDIDDLYVYVYTYPTEYYYRCAYEKVGNMFELDMDSKERVVIETLYVPAEKMEDEEDMDRSLDKQATKKVGDETLSASAYAYTPDKESPSTWKLRIDDANHTRAAVAALGAGFRGNRVQIPEADRAGVIRKVRAAYRKFFPDNDLPDVIKSSEAKEQESVLDRLVDALGKLVGGSQSDLAIPVHKQFDIDKNGAMWAIEPLYTAPNEVDGHGDVADLETINYMVESLNKANTEGRLQSGLFHAHKTEAWSLDKAWVNQCECMIGDQLIPEGQPIAKTLFHSEALFNLRQEGEISGLSIGAKGIPIPVEEDSEAPEGATRILKNVNFDWEHPELTYTSPSQGGAASMKNDVYDISKAKKATKEDLDKDQLAVLAAIGEEFISLEKASKQHAPSSSGEEIDSGEETKEEKGKANEMSDELKKQLETANRKIAVMELDKSLTGVKLTDEVKEDLVKNIALLEDEVKDSIVKALVELQATASEAVEKSADKKDNAMGELLDKEAGESGEPEEEPTVEKSFIEKVQEHQEAMKKKKGTK